MSHVKIAATALAAAALIPLAGCATSANRHSPTQTASPMQVVAGRLCIPGRPLNVNVTNADASDIGQEVQVRVAASGDFYTTTIRHTGLTTAVITSGERTVIDTSDVPDHTSIRVEIRGRLLADGTSAVRHGAVYMTSGPRPVSRIVDHLITCTNVPAGGQR